jgi:hypothetical protein
MDAVQRLDGSGYKIFFYNLINLNTKILCLRYSLALVGNYEVVAFSR